jgi:hypothetical protein
MIGVLAFPGLTLLKHIVKKSVRFQCIFTDEAGLGPKLGENLPEFHGKDEELK